MINEKKLLEIERRAMLTTPGQWSVEARHVDFTSNLSLEEYERKATEWGRDEFLQFHISGPQVPSGRGDFVGPDAVFIVHAREDIFELIEEVRRLRSLQTGEGDG